jgi:hypothetical protein
MRIRQTDQNGGAEVNEGKEMIVNRGVTGHDRATAARARRWALRPGARVGLLGAAILAVAVLAAILPTVAGAATNGSSPRGVPPLVDVAPHFAFQTLGDPADKTFNELLGVNDFDEIAGYHGSGTPATKHPNRGFTVAPFSGPTFRPENYPGSQQTEVTGVNDEGTTVGTFASKAGARFGFMLRARKYIRVAFPGTTSNPPVNELLGLNNHSMAAGFYEDASKVRHAYTWSRVGNVYTQVDPPGSVSATATGIDDAGAVSGYFTDTTGTTYGFVESKSTYTPLQFPGATKTEALGLNDQGLVVGMYVDSSAYTHGFIYVPPLILRRAAAPHIPSGAFAAIDDPAGVGTTVVNGVNNVDTVVGFYFDSKGRTDGMIGFLRPPGTPGS